MPFPSPHIFPAKFGIYPGLDIKGQVQEINDPPVPRKRYYQRGRQRRVK